MSDNSEHKTPTVAFRISKDVYDQVQTEAKHRRRSAAWIIRETFLAAWTPTDHDDKETR